MRSDPTYIVTRDAYRRYRSSNTLATLFLISCVIFGCAAGMLYGQSWRVDLYKIEQVHSGK